MGLFSGIGHFFQEVTSVVDKVTQVLQKPLDFITKPLDGLVNGLLSKLPFGNVIQPFADTFLNKGLAWLAAGPLGGLSSFIASAATTAEKVDSVLHSVDGALNGGVGSLNPQALENAQNLFSFAHARTLLS